MIRKLIPLIFVAGLAGCAAPESPSTDTTNYASSSNSGSNASLMPSNEGSCDSDTVQNLVGQQYSSSRDSSLRSSANVSQLRILRPGEVMTLEYNPNRLNVILENNDVISALRCG